MRFLFALLLCLPTFVAAQTTQDSIFKDYAAYDAFVDEHIKGRDFVPLIQALGGRDEYTIEQLNGLQNQFGSIYATDFTDKAIFKERDLGEGFRTEVRSYWGPSGYIWYGAILHDRGDALVVINFRMNSNATPVLETY